MRPPSRRPERWETDGFVPAVDVLAPEEVAEYRGLFDAVEARVGREQAEVKLHDRHLDEEFVWWLATHPRILDAVEEVIGPDILLLGSHFFCKYPAAERGVISTGS
jgi:non-heme Fe2+,alpha-ketoglutarate-dependent halogenase